MGAIYFLLTNYLFKKTGACFNPFRPIAFSIIGNPIKEVWVYLLANCLGGVLGAILGNFLMSETSFDMR